MNNLICNNERRRENVRKHQLLNGLDYLEVGPDFVTLTVYFLGKAPVDLDETQVRIEGGQRIRDIKVKTVEVVRHKSIEFDDSMKVVVDKQGDFSDYSLRVVEKNEQDEWQPHSQFDPRYGRIEFNFKIDCPSELDCKQEAVCPTEPQDKPDINYLAKDYSSFRQLILDRLALVMPGWQERHVPDIGIAVVEVLAYVGDHLSYYQDAVATEAYLNTARKRISVRRHARLVDYTMHEGCNARAWLCVQTDSDLQLDPKETYFITGYNEAFPSTGTVLTKDDLRQVPSSLYEAFEPMGDEAIQIYRDHNRIRFYTWGDKECCLPRGSISATLAGELLQDTVTEEEPPCNQDNEPDQDTTLKSAVKTSQTTDNDSDHSTPRLHLKPGDVLIFEEKIGPETGHPGDADPRHRHAVRLTKVEAGVDKLNNNAAVVEVAWDEEDALPFPLCISALGPPPECRILEDVSVACGNVVLVDHGTTTGEEDLGSVAVEDTVECCKAEGILAEQKIIPENYHPSLQEAPLTFSQALTPEIPASMVLNQDIRQALPQVSLTSSFSETDASDWFARRDLFASGPDDQHFVAEVDNDGRASLRFGDDVTGEKPDAGMTFRANYRIGNGLAGNVGAEAISHLVLRKIQLSGTAVSIRNPMPAQGGTEPEPIEEVKLYAPYTFRKELQRAVTADDYAAIVEREFKSKVQRAAARLCWNGSWYEVLVAVDPYGQEEADEELLDVVSKRLHRYRRMGHDLVVKSAQRVPLDIEILVCVLPNYLRGHVKSELLDLFSNHKLLNGRLGFFHPDNLTFGEGIHLSKLVAVAQAVVGVESVQVTRLQRQHEPPNQEIETGILPLGAFEIARLDNNPSFPENGILKLDMRGGR